MWRLIYCRRVTRVRGPADLGGPVAVTSFLRFVLAAAAVGGPAAVELAGQTPGEDAVALEPTWQWRSSVAIEWAEPVSLEGSAEPLIVVCTSDGRLHLLDLANGRRHTQEPVQARPGLRFGGETPHIEPAPGDILDSSNSASSGRKKIYCFDRFVVYALNPAPQGGLAWQSGLWPPGVGKPMPGETVRERFQGDPETLPRIVALQPTPAGPVVARDDGHVALLDAEDGQVRWEVRLPWLSTVRAHGQGNAVVMVFRRGRTIELAELNVATGECRGTPVPENVPWPLWSALTAEGLLLAESNQLRLRDRDGNMQTWRVEPGRHVLATALALHPGAFTGDQAAPVQTLIFGTSDGRLQGLDLRSFDLLWTATDQTDGADWLRLDVHGHLVVAMKWRSAAVHEVRTGKRLLHINVDQGDRLLDVHLAAAAAWCLAASDDAQPQLWLRAMPMATEASADARDEGRWKLGLVERFRRAIWGRQQVVIVGARDLVAYRLP